MRSDYCREATSEYRRVLRLLQRDHWCEDGPLCATSLADGRWEVRYQPTKEMEGKMEGKPWNSIYWQVNDAAQGYVDAISRHHIGLTVAAAKSRQDLLEAWLAPLELEHERLTEWLDKQPEVIEARNAMLREIMKMGPGTQ
jgi:hypothetical protein